MTVEVLVHDILIHATFAKTQALKRNAYHFDHRLAKCKELNYRTTKHVAHRSKHIMA